jgi:hypothetical protein
MRIGETIAVEGRPLDVNGQAAAFLEGETWDSTDDAVATVTPDGGNARLAEVEAIASGSATVSFEGTDQFSDPHSSNAPVVVLDAITFVLVIGATNDVTVIDRDPALLVLRPDAPELTPGGLRVSVVAVPQDARGNPGPAIAGTYSAALTDIEWSTDSQRVLFDVGAGADPTASDTLELDLVPAASGDDVIHLTALNSLAQPVALHRPVRVLATAAVAIAAVNDVV